MAIDNQNQISNIGKYGKNDNQSVPDIELPHINRKSIPMSQTDRSFAQQIHNRKIESYNHQIRGHDQQTAFRGEPAGADNFKRIEKGDDSIKITGYQDKRGKYAALQRSHKAEQKAKDTDCISYSPSQHDIRQQTLGATAFCMKKK